MPGLINSRPLAPASTAQTGERDDLWKFFTIDKAAEEVYPPSLIPGTAVRFFPIESVKPQFLARPKQSTDSLAEIVRVRLYGDGVRTERMVSHYSSSGSEHDPSSICLAAMVNDFMESEDSFARSRRRRCDCLLGNCDGKGGGRESEDSKANIGAEISEVLEGLARSASDREAELLSHITHIVSSINGGTSSVVGNESVNPVRDRLDRIVMTKLRRAGYNAAICKSRWAQLCGMPAGDYEYMDVIGKDTSRKNHRLIVDIDFRAQFEIARPTDGYSAVWKLLPPIFVGKPERLQRIIDVMSEAAKQSLKLKGLHLPPWRKPSYLKAKWFSPYKRTSNDHAHPSRELEHRAGREFQGIALRGSGFDARCTNELEMLYHEAGATFLAKDCIGGREATANRKSCGKREAPEGIADRYRNERDAITVIGTDWQPPAVAPRSAQKPDKITGLASVLMQAGLARPRAVAKQEERLAGPA